MENQTNPDQQLCVVSIVFPYDDDSVALSVKKKITEALAELPRVKIETRITEVRNGG